MSWFDYGAPKKRHLRKGVFLRIRSLPDALFKQINKNIKVSKAPQLGDRYIDWVEVKEICPKGQVLLEVWAHKLQRLMPNKPVIYSVIHLLVDENAEWVCEGDQGRGYKSE